MGNYCLNILHLYPDLLNLYGDKGNIECMRKRLAWRGIGVDIKACTSEKIDIDFEGTDIIFLGGGTEREQAIVCKRLKENRDDFLKFAEKGGTIVAVCGGFEMLGKEFYVGESKAEGIGVLDIYSERSCGCQRFTGNIAVESEKFGKIVGFENHTGIMNIGDYKPLGKVIKGFGNDGRGVSEGVMYKNVFGTFIHGPLFPKNPKLCDGILEKALKNKYEDFGELCPLDDELEIKAKDFILNKMI